MSSPDRGIRGFVGPPSALGRCRWASQSLDPPYKTNPPTGDYTSLAQTFQKSDHRQEQCHDNGPDDATETNDHDRLQQANQALDGRIHFLVVEICNLVQHRVE